MDDLELLQAYADRRDQQAFAQLVSRHGGWLYSAARRQLADGHLAEDVTQAVFWVLSRRAKALRNHTAVSVWLFVTLGYCIKETRRHRARIQRREQEVASMQPSNIPDATWEDIAPLLETLVARLGKADQHAVLLRFYEQKPLAEVGRLMGTSEEAARKQVDRAVEKLRGMLQKQGVTGTSAGLSAVLVGNVVQQSPASLVDGVMKAIGGRSTVAGSIAAGAMKMMALARVRTAVCMVMGGALLIGVAALAVERPTTTATAQTRLPAIPEGRNVETGDSERVLIERLMRQNEDARRRIGTIRYQFARSSRSITGNGELLRSFTGSAQQAGKMRWVETSEAVPDQDGRQRDTVFRVILSEGYSAVWVKGTRNANLTRHTSIEQMSDDEKAKIAVCGGTDPLLWGFGLGGETWREAYDKHPTVIRWTAEQTTLDSGQKAYRVSRFSPYTKDRKKPDMRFLLEPERGSLITQIMWYSRESNAAGEAKIEVTQVPRGGPWVPVSITDTKYTTEEDAPARPVGQVKSTRTIRLSGIEVNPVIPVKQFTWEALGLTDGTDLVERGVNGDLSGFVYRNGELGSPEAPKVSGEKQ